MSTALKPKLTRFRAYQLGEEGSSFSYFDGSHFTLIEARVTDLSRPRIKAELQHCGVTTINCLHITSWDDDHCTEDNLKEILTWLEPQCVEYPGYDPHTNNGKACLRLISDYKQKHASRTTQKVDPPYIKSLDEAEKWGYRDIIYWPRELSDKSNDNSTVKLFRTGCFNVASLGDVESLDVSSYLKNCHTFADEVDVMVLAHHGADNGFTTNAFLRKTRPRVAICSSNYDNQFEHPKQEIRDLLYEYEIPIYTTKTGDVVVLSEPPHTRRYKVVNLIADSTEVSSEKEFTTRKSKTLGHNMDTVRDIYAHRPNPFKRF
jgi:competence protein ComEC